MPPLIPGKTGFLEGRQAPGFFSGSLKGQGHRKVWLIRVKSIGPRKEPTPPLLTTSPSQEASINSLGMLATKGKHRNGWIQSSLRAQI